MKPIRTFREFRDGPDELLCTDPTIAAKHQLTVPFWVNGPIWKGGGVVSVEFVSRHPHYAPMGGHHWGTSDYTSLKYLFIPSAPPGAGDLPEPGPAWESQAEALVNRLLDPE